MIELAMYVALLGRLLAEVAGTVHLGQVIALPEVAGLKDPVRRWQHESCVQRSITGLFPLNTAAWAEG